MSLPWCFFSQAVELLNASMTVLNQASLEPSIPSIVVVGRTASEVTILVLRRSKCLPVLLWKTEACPMVMRAKISWIRRYERIYEIFRTDSSTVITEFQRNFNFLSIRWQLTICTAKFLQASVASENHICVLQLLRVLIDKTVFFK